MASDGICVGDDVAGGLLSGLGVCATSSSRFAGWVVVGAAVSVG